MIINTHSDYVIRELNNLIMLSNKEIRTNRKFEELGYKEDEFVNSSEVTSYMFNFKNKSSKNISIKRIPINEFGFDVESIDNTIDELNNTTEELFYLIKYPIKNED
ncbi:hypothetical protein [Sphingobacterium daejeonense]|uniref:hypothetical protein n=1 Tax=Sphingobacterium daejeonense TaxID=371142 RepID=UPI0010C523C2|nr:hypothetical protein [Sphingobacterium daejeonense]VTQ01797.1 Uncharacterized conserved protein [Sphingobacterium daejeonense]